MGIDGSLSLACVVITRCQGRLPLLPEAYKLAIPLKCRGSVTQRPVLAIRMARRPYMAKQFTAISRPNGCIRSNVLTQFLHWSCWNRATQDDTPLFHKDRGTIANAFVICVIHSFIRNVAKLSKKNTTNTLIRLDRSNHMHYLQLYIILVYFLCNVLYLLMLYSLQTTNTLFKITLLSFTCMTVLWLRHSCEV